MEKFKKLSREEMKLVMGGEVAPQVCGHGSCKASSDCGVGCSCMAVPGGTDKECSSVS